MVAKKSHVSTVIYFRLFCHYGENEMSISAYNLEITLKFSRILSKSQMFSQ